MEGLESRLLFSAGYNWSSANHTLDVILAADTSVTVTKSGTVVSLTLNNGTFNSASGDTATGHGTSTISLENASIDQFFEIYTNVNVASTNNITFSGTGTLTSDTIVLGIGDDVRPAVGTITTTGGFDLDAASVMNLLTRGNIVIGSGSLLDTGDGGVINLYANQETTATSGDFVGVDIQGTVQVGDFSYIEIHGRGGSDSGTDSHYGVYVHNGGQILATGSSYITIDGTGGTGEDVNNNSQNYGVAISDTGTEVTVENGYIDITGTGGDGPGASNVGVGILNGALVEFTSDNPIPSYSYVSITGTGGSGDDGTISGNFGVLIYGVGDSSTAATVASGGADITIDGTGGAGAGSINVGVAIGAGGSVSSTGAGAILITGAGGANGTTDNDGILLEKQGGNAGQITANTGSVTLQGTEGTGGTGIVVSDSSISANANINFTANQINFSGSTISAPDNTVSFQTRTNDGTVDIALGGADSATLLGLTDGELDQVEAGSINVGSTDNLAAVAVTNNITRSDATNVNLYSKSTITFNGGSIDADGGDVTADGLDGTLPQTTGTDATAGSMVVYDDLKINIASVTADTGYDVLHVAGAVKLQGGDLVLTGSYVPQGGDIFTVVTGTSLTGTFSQAEGDVITFNGKSLHVHYTATSVQLIANSAPTADAGGTYNVSEGGNVQLDGTGSSDPDQTSASLTYAWDLDGDGVFGETGAAALRGDETGSKPTFKTNGLDGTANYTVTLKVTDSGGLVDTDTATVHVTNVAPTASLVAPANAALNVAASFTLKATDPSKADTTAGFTYVINWGDGSAAQTVTGSGAGKTVQHTYTKLGTFTVSVTARDKDGATSTAVTAKVAVHGAQLVTDPADSSLKALDVAGTSGNDTISIQSIPGGAKVILNGNSLGQFQFSGTLIVDGQAGNDTITIDPALSAKQLLFGGAGNDTITSGNGPAVLIGGLGNDNLTGGNGRDILVGGDGSDSLQSGNGDDLLIAGATTYDADTVANWKKWLAIQAEWTSGNSYSTRVGHLNGSISGGLNGSNLLTASGANRTVLHDVSTNLLKGENGSDWFFAGSSDTTDLQPGELKVGI